MKYIYQIISLIAVSSKFTDVSAECADIFDVCTFLFDATSCRYQPRCSWNGRSCVALDCFVHKNKDSCEDDFGCYWVGDDESEDSSDWNGHNENNWPSDVGHGSGSPGSGPPGYGPGTSLWTAEKEATKEYRVKLSAHTILYTLFAFLCLFVIVFATSSKGDVRKDSDKNKDFKKCNTIKSAQKSIPKQIDIV